MVERYEIQFISIDTGDIIHVASADEFDAFRYDMKLNDVGKCGVGMIADAWVEEAVAVDTLIEVKRHDPITDSRITEDIFVVRDYEYFLDEANTRRAVIGAYNLTHLLMRRVMYDDTDPLAAGGYVTRDGEGSEMIRNFIYYQIGAGASASRKLTDLTVNFDGDGINIGGDYDVKTNLKDAVKEMAERAGVILEWSRQSGRAITLDIGKRFTDRTRTNNAGAVHTEFSLERGNMLNPRLIVQRENEANFIFAIGQGTPATRIIQFFLTPAVSDSPWNRMEHSQQFDRKDELDSLYLTTGAVATLSERRRKITLEFGVNPDVTGALYRIDWNLGDIISAKFDSFEKDLQIGTVSVEYSGGVEDLKVELRELPL